MADQHITPSSHSALTRESSRSSPSRVVGGRWLRGAAHSRRSRRPASSARAAEPRRSSRLLATQPRSDYSISERWSYGADVYETRYHPPHARDSAARHKRARTASYDTTKPAATSAGADNCVAYCTRSRTALKTSESVCEHLPNSLKTETTTLPSGRDETPTSTRQFHFSTTEGGLLPLDDRDFAYSPFSSSTVTELLDSDYSVYSPTASRRKGKKRKRSSHRSLSNRKRLLNLEECRKKFKIDSHSKDVPDSSREATDSRSTTSDLERSDQPISEAQSCSYPLRNRHRELGPPTSTVISESSASPSTSDVTHSEESKSVTESGRSSSPPSYKDIQEPGSSKAHSSVSKLLIVPRDLPYLRQTNARRSIAAATGATLGACLTRGAGSTHRQRQDSASKRQAGGGEAAGGGRRARARDMPQPQPSTARRDKRGKSTLGSCASTGSVSGRSQPQPLTTGAVASTSSSPPAASAAMPDQPAADSKLKGKEHNSLVGLLAASPAEECGAAGAGAAAGGASESSSEEGEVGRLQALLEARGLPPHLLGALGPRMQHLLHRSHAHTEAASKAAQLLAGLQATGDEGQQLQAVIEMCQLLVMGNEDTLAGFPVRQVVPALVNLLGHEHNFDMMNHACRALTYMLEALPRSSGAVALAVPAFLDKLQAITCMDVAEQSLTALDMLSRRHSKAILQARGVSAVLTYLDFFSINAQRAALSITANCCQNLTPDEFHLVRDSLQLLANRLTHQDKKSVEYVCSAFSRLVDSFQHEPARLQEIATPDLLTNLQQLLVVQPPLVSGPTFITVLRLLWTMCSMCPQLAVALHQRSIADTALCLLTHVSRHHQLNDQSLVSGPTFITVLRLLWTMCSMCPQLAVALHQRSIADTALCLLTHVSRHHQLNDQIELVPRSPQELYELTCLTAELLPRLPTDGIFAVQAHLDRNTTTQAPHWQWRDDRGVWRSYSWAESRALEAGAAAGEEEVCLTTLGRSYTVELASMQQLNDQTGTARPVQRVVPAQKPAQPANAAPDPRIAVIRSNPSMVRAILAVLHEVYWSSAGPAVRSQALRAILRCVYYADAPLLRRALKTQVISSHIAGMMASSDLRIVVGSLQLAEILMQRLPEEMAVQFRREGVLHQVALLAEKTREDKLKQEQSKSPVAASAPSSGSASPPASTSTTTMDNKNLTLAFSASGSFVTTMLPTANDHSASEPGQASGSAQVSTTVHRSGSPLQLAEMLKRKRAIKRAGAGAARPRRRDDAPPAARHDHEPPAGCSYVGRGGGGGGAGRGASKASMFLSSLHPSRWGRSKDTPAAHHLPPHNKEKVREWIESVSGRLQQQWGALGGGGGALQQLSALGAALPLPGRRAPALRHLRDTLAHHDVSPFELNHSGVIEALLQFLTGEEGDSTTGENETETPPREEDVVNCEQRLRLFLNVFADMPLEPDGGATWDESCSLEAGACAPLSLLVGKVNACVSHLEQFPVRVHDLPQRAHSSALNTLNTHQLMCDLKRHPTCTNLKQWKGGVVRIDPLALVQAIERYLAARGYASARPREGAAAAHSDDDADDDDDVDDALAAPVHTTDTDHKLEFLIGDKVLPYNMTVYQAVRQYSEQTDTDTDTETPLANAGIWVQTHTIYYRAVEAVEPPRPDSTPGKKGKGAPTKLSSRRKPDLLWNEGVVPPPASPLFSLLRRPVCAPAPDVQDPCLAALRLLHALHAISRHWHSLYRELCVPDTGPLLPHHHFINHKLAAKANRQLQDPLVIMTGNLPPWLKKIAYACPFVFPFECRHLLFYVVSFDRDRALQRLLEAGGERAGGADAERIAPRLDRRKRTVQRHNVLRQAEHVMHEFAHSKALLEIQYENEVGTGLGPTLEFYALVSQELQRADLDLWHGSENFKQKPSFGGEIVKSSPAVSDLASSVRDALSLGEDREKVAYVSWPCGLFPQALGRNARASHLSRVKAKFRFLGKFMAKAVMDSRMVDIPLSGSMYRWMVGEQRWLGLRDVALVAPELSRSLRRLHAALRAAQHRNQPITALELDGCPIEELGLDFILPGDGCTELRRGGRDIPVTPTNLRQYIQLVHHWLLYEGVIKQMEAFKEGFESVFPLENLKIFYPEELEQVFCGSPSGSRSSRWDARLLSSCIRPDHGYTAASRAIRWLVDILCTYTRDEQRLFLQFVTGSPRLPAGGFRALNPPLTVVRKSLESALDADEYLPSVMTCVNYLKLPDYSSPDVMRAKLRLAASEGQHSFHLS